MKLTPYDTGQRAEPRPWQAQHRETEADFGKVDFDAEDGFTLATLWIERQEDGSYALAGYTNVALKVTAESNDPTDDEITITVPEPQYVWVATVEDDDMSSPLVVVANSQKQLEEKLMKSYGTEFAGEFDEWFERCSGAATIIWDRYEPGREWS